MQNQLVSKTKYLIIGGSAGGVSAANMLAKLEPAATITCVTAEVALPYNKCFLVDWLTGDKASEQLQLRLNPNIVLLKGLKVLSLDVKAKVAYLSNDELISYDKVLLAIGVQAFKPQIAGLDLEHVFTFHDYQDVAKLGSFMQAKQPKCAVVIGAGLTGLECADALVRCGLKVTVIERTDQILGKLVDFAGAQHIISSMQAQGVGLYLNASVTQVMPDQVVLDSKIAIPADLVVLAAGVRPNQLTILNGDLELLNNYAVVNSHLQTNLVDVWAVGDMVVLPELLTGELVPSCSWPDAMLQGNYAAQNMAGRAVEYPGPLPVANSHFFGQDFISLGKFDTNKHLVQLNYNANNTYQKVVTNQASLVQGACLIGDVSLYPALKRAVMTGAPVNI